MPLIDLKTDLKSLKYGADRPGGGDSGQPYIKVDINKIDRGFNRFRMTNFDDGLVRGGTVGAINASVVDTLRIGKFLKDFPKGPLFITKQIGLQLSNPQLEHKKLNTNNPTRGGGLLRNVGNFVLNTANKILNAVGPTRIYNLGINTLAQVPVNAFGQHIQRHGFTPRRDNSNLYFQVAYHNREEANNRLSDLRKILGNNKDIANYISGPSSVYGIGRTIIRRRGDFIIEDQDITANSFATSGSLSKSADKRKISFSNANENLKNRSFLGASTYFMSALAENNFENDGEAILRKDENQPSSLNDKIASVDDPKKDTYIANSKETAASAKMRISGAFVGVSNYSSSIFTKTKFNSLTNFDTLKYKPSTLDNFTASNADTTTENTIGKWSGALTASNDLGTGSNAISTYIPTQIPNNPTLKTYAELQKRVKYVTDGNRGAVDVNGLGANTGTVIADVNKFNIYGDIKPKRSGNFTILNPSSPDYPVYYNGKETVKINIPWNKVNRENRVGSGRQDQINLTPIFSATVGSIDDTVNIPGVGEKNINDLVKFRIQALDGDNPDVANYMIFRAYITQFSDSSDASWNEVKYAGRGDKFYIYDGFSRKIQIGFKVAALSAQEMKPMYQKLNYLMGNTMPDYNEILMRGPLVRMTVGNWIDGQPGILNNVSYTVPQESPWEIGLGDRQLILPHIVEVSMTFTPIGSQTQDVNKISSKDLTTSHIAQNYNGKKEQLNYIE